MKNKKPFLNSPRSLDACRRIGIKPEDLLFKSKQDIRDPITEATIEPDLLQMRFQHYENMRKEKLQQAVAERLKIIEFENKGLWNPQKSLYIANSESPSKSILINPKSDPTMIEKEKRNIEKLKVRQEQEVKQMLDYELKLEKMRQENQTKLERQKIEEDNRQKALRKAQLQAEEEKKRQDEEEKRRQEEVAVNEKRKIMKAYEEEQLRAKQETKRLKKEAKQKKLQEEEDKRKKELYEKETKDRLQEQQNEYERKRKEMEKKDQLRKEV